MNPSQPSDLADTPAAARQSPAGSTSTPEGGSVSPLLLAEDLDELAALAGRVEPESVAAEIREVVLAWEPAQAVSNLLWHPGLIPADLRIPALVRALTGPDAYLQLAAAVGIRSVTAEADAEDPEVRQLTPALMGLVQRETEIVARQGAISLFGLLAVDDALAALGLLTHPDARVRAALLAALIEVFGASGLDDLLGDLYFVPATLAGQVRAVLAADGIDLGSPGSSLTPDLEYLPNLSEFDQH